MINIESPNKDTIDKYINKWNNLDEHYKYQETSLNKLFHCDYKDNTDLNQILIKASCLNAFYSTNIFSIYNMAKQIYDLNIDKRLMEGDPLLVNDIANININGKKYYFYSFASKYCSHHNNVEYPIYDYYVEKMLLYFMKRDQFYKFNRNDLKDYPKFKQILIEFSKFYKINGYSLRDIDKYLWLAGKEYFTKKY